MNFDGEVLVTCSLPEPAVIPPTPDQQGEISVAYTYRWQPLSSPLSCVLRAAATESRCASRLRVRHRRDRGEQENQGDVGGVSLLQLCRDRQEEPEHTVRRTNTHTLTHTPDTHT